MPTDALDITAAIVHSSPADIASWPITTAIERLTMRPGKDAGLSFAFSANQVWPDYTPPGWDGPIQYTVWAGVQLAGQWHIAGFIQMWRTRPSTGAPILSQWNDWAYDVNRWGPMVDYRPQAGDRMLFFLSAGNARRGSAGAEGEVTSVRERSNVVVVELPAGDAADFTFDPSGRLANPNVPTLTPVPPPNPVVLTGPATHGDPAVATGGASAADLATVLAEIRKLSEQVQALTAAVTALKAGVQP